MMEQHDEEGGKSVEENMGREQGDHCTLLNFSGGARNFIETGQNFNRKFTCDIIYK